MASQPEWKRRFTAPVMQFPSWSVAAPDRLVAISNEDGSLQAWAIDLRSGERRRLTDSSIGVEAAFATPDGSGALWWDDATGDERGRWMITPFEGGEPRPLLPNVPDGWDMGFSVAPGVAAVSLSHEDAYRVYVGLGEEPAMEIASAGKPLGIGPEWEFDGTGLSADGALLALRHSDRGDITRFGLRVLDTRSGDIVGELVDPDRNLEAAAWSPVSGDRRLAFTHGLEGLLRPAIWDLAIGERRNLSLSLDLPGEVRIQDWWPDGSALLATHQFEGRTQLYRVDPATGETQLLVDPGGTIEGSGVRPDGEVWMRAESGGTPPRIVSSDGREVLGPKGERPPPGRAYRPLWFENPHEQRIHGFVVEPDGARPHPVVMMVHGGPDWAYSDQFDPWVQALVDHGYAVALVNYRGSRGYGVEFAESLRGDIGFPEVEDTVAGLDALAADGLVDSKRAVIEGWSWGGYVALLALGIRPERFVAGIGGIPVADYVMCHEDCSPPQKAWDVATLGGGPDEFPELYRERSPITYVDRVRAPVLVIAGTNDSRCPIRQVRHYVQALRERGGEVRVHEYEAGHHANSIDEELLQVELELEFLAEHVPSGGGRPDASAGTP